MVVAIALLLTFAASAELSGAVVEDAIPQSLAGRQGDPVRGRVIVVDRTREGFGSGRVPDVRSCESFRMPARARRF